MGNGRGNLKVGGRLAPKTGGILEVETIATHPYY